MEGVTTTIRDVQAVLLSLFTEKTILIGHSLESDLSAVKVILNFMTFTFWLSFIWTVQSNSCNWFMQVSSFKCSM